MSVATERVRAPVVAQHRPWWRSRAGQVGVVFALMLVAFLVARDEFPWPESLTWSTLGATLDDFQAWLIGQRNAADPNPLFAIFDGFRVFADNLVTWLNDLLVWMTWFGTAAAGTILVLRYGGWRAGLVVLAAFASFALMGLWEESMQTLALMLAAVALSLLVGIPIGILAGRSGPRAAWDHTRARRDADRAGVRVPDAGRDPVLRRPGRRGDRDDDLRRSRRGADHVARHPRRRGEHGRGRAVDGRDAAADPVQGAAAARAADDHPRHQPDDPVRALARRDRRADRRARPRRRRHERPLLVSRARDPRRVRDRDHGDRARPVDVGDRRPHRPDPPSRDRARADGD